MPGAAAPSEDAAQGSPPAAPSAEIPQRAEPVPTEPDFHFDFAIADSPPPPPAPSVPAPVASGPPLPAPADDLNFELTEAPNAEPSQAEPSTGGDPSDVFDFGESAAPQSTPAPRDAQPSPPAAAEVELAGGDDNLELLSFSETAPS